MTARRLGTFLVHCWALDDGAQRVVLEHIQSGERAVCRSLATAVEWMSVRCDGLPNEPVVDGDADTDCEPEEPAGERRVVV